MTSAQPPFVRKMHTSRRLSKPELCFPGAGCGTPHRYSLHEALLMGRARYTVKLCCGGVVSSFQVSLFPFRFRRLKDLKKGLLRTNILKTKLIFLFHILKFSHIKADCGLSSIILNAGYCSFHFLLNVTEILLSPSPSREKEIVF